jgi:hypothetical protein
MKKLVFGLIATVVLGFVGNAQENNPSNPENEFDYVGRIHNEALEKIINSEKEKQLFKNDPTKYCENLLIQEKIPTDAYVAMLDDKEVIKNMDLFNIYNVSFSPEQVASWQENKYINSTIKQYIKELSLLTEKYYKDLDYEDFKLNVIKLEEQAYNLKNNDKAFILSTASLARHTISFWSQNASSLSRYTGTGRGLGLADLGGAVGGAIRTYVMCIFTGPVGWASWAGSIIGSGLAVSAAYVITHH